MHFEVFVQDKFYKSLEAKNTGEALTVVARDIKSGLVPNFDSSKNHEIKLKKFDI